MSDVADRLRALADAAPKGPWAYRDADGMVLDAEAYFVVQTKGSPRNPELAAGGRLAALAPELARGYADALDALAMISTRRLDVKKADLAACHDARVWMQNTARSALAAAARLFPEDAA